MYKAVLTLLVGLMLLASGSANGGVKITEFSVDELTASDSVAKSTTSSADNQGALKKASLQGQFIAIEGDALVVDTSGIVEPGGTGGNFQFQWQSSTDGVNWSDEPLEIFRYMTPRQKHVGRYLRVVVSYIDDSGNTEIMEGPPSKPVQNVNNKPTGYPILKGKQEIGHQLSLDIYHISDEDSLGALSITWQKSKTPNNWEVIHGQKSSRLEIMSSHQGYQIRALVTYVDGHGTMETVASYPTKRIPSAATQKEFYTDKSDQQVCSVIDVDRAALIEARKRNLSCTTNSLASFSDEFICDKALPNNPDVADFFEESKRRGLNCGVGENSITQPASKYNFGVLYANRSDAFICQNFDASNIVKNEAKRRGLNCGVGESGSTQVAAIGMPSTNRPRPYQENIPDSELCFYAVRSGAWDKELYYGRYVKEAKRRGLTCGVNESGATQVASAPKPTVSSAKPTAAQKEAERLREELAALKAEKDERKQTISADKQVPLITIISRSSKGPQGMISGRVTDNTGVGEVRVEGQLLPLDGNGNFAANTYVPEGGISIIVEAFDLAGLSSSMSVRLNRDVVQTAAFSFDRLNPLRGKVAANPDALALIIGVADYKETSAPAVYADTDAKVFADYAAEKLGVPRQRIKTLVNDGADEKDVLLAAKRWLARGSLAGQSDIYVFFAGHGLASDDGEKMYLLPYDGAPELLDDTAIARKRLFSDIAAANPRSVTVFLDTCYSGTTRGPDMLIASRPIAIKAIKQSVPDNFTVMTAAAGDQTAKPLEEAKHGMFSYFLMKGMEGDADANQDNQITAGELHAYVQQNVIQQSSSSQKPELQGDADRVLVRFQ